MNEKIRELAEQANWLFADKVTGEFTDYDKRIQKFAELIVWECIDTVQKRCIGDHNREDAEVMRCVADLKEHFGVE